MPTWYWIALSFFIGLASPAVQADRVRLDSGDVFIGKVVSQTDGKLTLDHPMLGTIVLPAGKVVSVDSVTNVAGASGAKKTANKKTESPTSSRKAKASPERSFLADWDLSLSLGLTADEHNGTDTLNFNTRLSAKRERDKDRDRFQYQAFVTNREGQKSRQDMHAKLQHDWLNRPSPWFTYGQADYDHDAFKHYEHRISTLGGLGYDPSLNQKPGPAFRAGLGVTGEWGGDQPTEDASLFGGEVSWQFDERNKIELSAQAAPVFEEAITGRRYLTTAEWTTRLTETLGFRFGMRNERDTRVPDSIARDDRRLFGSVVIKF